MLSFLLRVLFALTVISCPITAHASEDPAVVRADPDVRSPASEDADSPRVANDRGATQRPFKRHIVHVESSGPFFGPIPIWPFGGYSLNYEYAFERWLTVRVGLATNRDVSALGGLVMANFMTTGEHKLEIGLGVSFTPRVDDPVLPLPAASLAYRYQPDDGGLFMRVGAVLGPFLAAPLGFSIGGVF